MEFIIDTLEIRQTSAGKEYKSVTLKSGDQSYEKVSLWSDNPDYNTFVEGGHISGEVFKNEKGYWNFKSANAKTAYTGGKTGAMNKVMETKNTNIMAAQDRKNDAIARAGAMRDATLVTIASLKDQPFPTNDDFKHEWESWVKYFLGKGEEPFV